MPVQVWTPGQVLTAAELKTITDLLLFPTALSGNLNPGVVGNMYICTATLTLTLPAPTVAGQAIGIKVRGSSAIVTVNRNSADVVYGPGLNAATTFTMGADGAFIVLVADGTNWHVCGGQVDTGWVAIPTYTNSWVSNAGPATGGTVAGYRLQGNIVRLGGSIKSGASGNAAFTLPALVRPATYPPIANSSTTSGGGAIVWITSTSGVWQPFLLGGGTIPGLDGITYLVDQ